MWEPGLYFLELAYFYSADELKDHRGKDLPGHFRLNLLSSYTEIGYLSPSEFLGGHPGLGLGTTLATGHLERGSGSSSKTGKGDSFFFLANQWKNYLFSKLYYHHLLVGVMLPTGDYDKDSLLNLGCNLYTFHNYYTCTTFLTPRLETSWKFIYNIHTTNHDFGPKGDDLRPGQLLEINADLSYEIIKGLRLGLIGYCWQQITEDELNGHRMENSKEKSFSIGAAVLYYPGRFIFHLGSLLETKVENLPQGISIFCRIIYSF